MIVIICAMSEERDAFLSMMKNVKKVKIEKILYHGMPFDNKCYKGKLLNKEVLIAHCGVGKVYAAIVTTLLIKKYRPELVINVGCAGSINSNIRVGDVVVATRIADWDVDVPDWERSIYSDKMSFACDGKFIKITKSLKNKLIKTGFIVSGDEFVHKRSQVNEIKKYFPEALCVEMEGCSIANTCYAFGCNCAIVRSISDETSTKNNYKILDYNLNKACFDAAYICSKIIQRY